MLVAGSELHTITNNTAEVMSHIGMNDVPSYIEFTPRDFDSDIERDPPSCAEDSSFCDDTSRFAEQKIEVKTISTRCRGSVSQYDAGSHDESSR